MYQADAKCQGLGSSGEQNRQHAWPSGTEVGADFKHMLVERV